MQLTRLFAILFIISLILTTVLSDSTWFDTNDDNDDNRVISKRYMFGNSHHHHNQHDPGQPRHCVRCKFSLMRCCAPNVCVKRRLRTDKCLRIKA